METDQAIKALAAFGALMLIGSAIALVDFVCDTISDLIRFRSHSAQYLYYRYWRFSFFKFRRWLSRMASS